MRSTAREARPAAPQPHSGDLRHLWVIGGVAIWTAVYYLAFDPVGYIISTSVYLLGLTAYFHRGKWVANILTSVLFAIGSYVLFVKVFGVMLAQGMIKF
jgi:putative tricarboxylic transport membrane protein